MSEMARRLVILTAEERSFAESAGKRRNSEDVSFGCPPGGGFIAFGDNGDRQNCLGTIGEAAFAKFIGIPYVPPRMRAAADIAGFQVRTTFRNLAPMPIRPRDKDDDLFVLVNRIKDDLYRVAGWIRGRDAKKVGVWHNPPVGQKLGPAWFVQERLLTRFTVEDVERVKRKGTPQ